MYGNNFAGIGNVGTEMAYDLRQTYAKLVGDHLEDIAAARKADNYNIYYKNLRDLHIIVNHKLKNKEVEGEDGKKIKASERYMQLSKKAVELANEHPDVWLGKVKDPIPCAEIEEALNAIEMLLYERIDEAKMFGGSTHTPGL